MIDVEYTDPHLIVIMITLVIQVTEESNCLSAHSGVF